MLTLNGTRLLSWPSFRALSHGDVLFVPKSIMGRHKLVMQARRYFPGARVLLETVSGTRLELLNALVVVPKRPYHKKTVAQKRAVSAIAKRRAERREWHRLHPS